MSVNHEPTPATEGPDPGHGQVPVPVWLFVLLGLLGYWGMRHLDSHAGGFHPQVYDPYPSLTYVTALHPQSDSEALFVSGRRVYEVYCSVCHQPTGQGVGGQFPPLAGADWVTFDSPNRLIRLVLDGIQGPIVVNGQNYNGAMPPWRDLLTDEEIAAVLTYVRGNAAWGNTAPPVTPEEVGVLRERTAGRPTAWSAAELLQIAPNE